MRGDVHAHLEVVIPSRLDHKQSKLLKEFKLLRDRDEAEVVSTASQNSGGLFSRAGRPLRESFVASSRILTAPTLDPQAATRLLT
ncbi:hypothetical protein ABT116_10625, partial [Streptomyces sp. NPDC002130]